MSDRAPELYKVTGINTNGSRVIVENRLSSRNAGRLRQLLLTASRLIGVEVEAADDFHMPIPLYRLIGLSEAGDLFCICDFASFEAVVSERRRLIKSKAFVRFAIEPANSLASDPFDQ